MTTVHCSSRRRTTTLEIPSDLVSHERQHEVPSAFEHDQMPRMERQRQDHSPVRHELGQQREREHATFGFVDR